MPQVNNKPTSEKEKFGSNKKLALERIMNGLGKPIRKRIQNLRKCSNQSEIAACEQITTSEKMNFCPNIVFPLYFKIRVKKIRAAKPLAFSLHFLFRGDENHYPNLPSKIINITYQRRANCSQTTSKRLAASVASHCLMGMSYSCRVV